MRTLLPLILLAASCTESASAPVVPAAVPAADGVEGFHPLPPPGPGDWLAVHEEGGQSFEVYVAGRPLRVPGDGDHLAVLPIGPFSAEERSVLERSAAFAAAWFDLRVVVLPGADLPADAETRDRPAGRQYRTDAFLRRMLPRAMPDDALAIFGVTMADLYPDESWNYVFGQASLRGGVAVWSFARYFGRFDRGYEDEGSLRLALLRALKLVVHEAGHVFGLAHCIEYRCAMNGSNSLAEMDGQPLVLCPPCLRKLRWNRGFDVAARYDRLAALAGEEWGLDGEAEWFARQATAARTRGASGSGR